MADLKEQLANAIAERNAAEQFSREWFAAKAEVEELLDQIAAAETAARLGSAKVTDEQLAEMDYVLSDAYDDD